MNDSVLHCLFQDASKYHVYLPHSTVGKWLIELYSIGTKAPLLLCFIIHPLNLHGSQLIKLNIAKGWNDMILNDISYRR